MSLQKITSAFVYHTKFGFQEAEKFRQSINSIAGVRHVQPLVIGGARSDRHLATVINTLYDHPNYWDVEIDWTEMSAGWTVRARLEVLTESGGTVTTSIRNVTDAVDIAGSAIVATSYLESTVVIPVPGVLGIKRYRLQLKSNSTVLGWNAVGVIEIFG